jgi:hypothetical protein
MPHNEIGEAVIEQIVKAMQEKIDRAREVRSPDALTRRVMGAIIASGAESAEQFTNALDAKVA